MVENEIPDQETQEVEKKVEPIVVSQLLAEVSWVKDEKQKRGVLVVLANNNNALKLLEFNDKSHSLSDFLSSSKEQRQIDLLRGSPAADQYQKLKTAQERILPQLNFSSSIIHCRRIELDRIVVDDHAEGPDFLKIPIIKIDSEDDVNEFIFSDDSVYRGFANAVITTTGKQSIVLIPIQGNEASYILAVALQTDQTFTIGHSGPAGERLVGEIVSVLFTDLNPKHGGERRPFLRRLIEGFGIEDEIINEFVNQIIAKLTEQTEPYVLEQIAVPSTTDDKKNEGKPLWPRLGNYLQARKKELRIGHNRRVRNAYLSILKRELLVHLKRKKQERTITDNLLDFASNRNQFNSSAHNASKPLEGTLYNSVIKPFFEEHSNLSVMFVDIVAKAVETVIKCEQQKRYLTAAEALETVRKLGQILTQEDGATDNQLIDSAPKSAIKQVDFTESEQVASGDPEKPSKASEEILEPTSADEVGLKLNYSVFVQFGEEKKKYDLGNNQKWPTLSVDAPTYLGPNLSIIISDFRIQGRNIKDLEFFLGNKLTTDYSLFVNGKQVRYEVSANSLPFSAFPGDVVTLCDHGSETQSTFVLGYRGELELVKTNQVANRQTFESPSLKDESFPPDYQIVGYVMTDKLVDQYLKTNIPRVSTMCWHIPGKSKEFCEIYYQPTLQGFSNLIINSEDLGGDLEYALLGYDQAAPNSTTTFRKPKAEDKSTARGESYESDVIVLRIRSHLVAHDTRTGVTHHLKITDAGLVVTWSEKAISTLASQSTGADYDSRETIDREKMSPPIASEVGIAPKLNPEFSGDGHRYLTYQLEGDLFWPNDNSASLTIHLFEREKQATSQEFIFLLKQIRASDTDVYINGQMNSSEFTRQSDRIVVTLDKGDTLTLVNRSNFNRQLTFVYSYSGQLELVRKEQTRYSTDNQSNTTTGESSEESIPADKRVIGYFLSAETLSRARSIGEIPYRKVISWLDHDANELICRFSYAPGLRDRSNKMTVDLSSLRADCKYALLPYDQYSWQNNDKLFSLNEMNILELENHCHLVAINEKTGVTHHLKVDENGLIITYSQTSRMDQLSVAESLGYPIDYTEIAEMPDNKVNKLKLQFDLMIDGLSRRYGATEIVITILELRNNTAIKFESAYFSLNSNFPKINGRVLSPNEVNDGVNLNPGDVVTVLNYYGHNYSTFLFDSTRKLRLLFSNQFQDTGSYSTIAPIGEINVATQSQNTEKIPPDSYEIIGYAGMSKKTITWDDIGVLEMTTDDDGQTKITYKSNSETSELNWKQLQPNNYLSKTIGSIVHWLAYLPNGLIVTYRKDSGGKLIPVTNWRPVPVANEQNDLLTPGDQQPPDVPAKPHIEHQPRLQPGGEIKKIVTIEKPDEATIGFPLQLETRLDDGGLSTSTRSVRLMDGQRLFYNHNPDLAHRGPSVDVSITSNREYRTQSIYLTCDSIEASNQLLVVINGLARDNQPVYKYHLGTATTKFPIQPGDIITIQNKNSRFSTTYLFTFDLQLELISATDISTQTLFEASQLDTIPLPYKIVGYLNSSERNQHPGHGIGQPLFYWSDNRYLIPTRAANEWYLKFNSNLQFRSIYKEIPNETPFLINSSTPILPGDHLTFTGQSAQLGKQKVYHLKFLECGLVVTYETLN